MAFLHLFSRMPKAKSKRVRSKASVSAVVPDSGAAQPDAAPSTSHVFPSPPPEASQSSCFGLTQETIIDGLYNRMKRDGLLPFAPGPTNAPGPANAPGPSSAAQDPATQVSTHSNYQPGPPPGFAHHQATINQTLSTILGTGETQAAEPQLPPLHCVKLSAPLGAHVSHKIKANIWEGQFVHMQELVCPVPRFGEEKSKPPVQLAISEWMSAFQIFASILCERQPEASSGLLKYMSTVQGLAKSFGPEAWRHYDENFRWSKQFDAHLQWGVLDIELYTMSAHKASGKPRNIAQYKPRPQLPFRAGTCWAFQRQGYCNYAQCKFKATHCCYKCQGPHKTSSCHNSSLSQQAPPRAGPSKRGGHARKT